MAQITLAFQVGIMSLKKEGQHYISQREIKIKTCNTEKTCMNHHIQCSVTGIQRKRFLNYGAK